MASKSCDQFKDAFQALVQEWDLCELLAKAEKFRDMPMVVEMIKKEVLEKSRKEVLGCEFY